MVRRLVSHREVRLMDRYRWVAAPMADLVIAVLKRDLAFSLELALDLAMQRLLVGLDAQQEVGPLLLELPKKGFWVCKASA